MAFAGGGGGGTEVEEVKEQKKLFTITKFTGAARCCCSNSNAQSPTGTVFWSHTRENERCPVCGKFLSSECVECEEQIGLRPGYSFAFIRRVVLDASHSTFHRVSKFIMFLTFLCSQEQEIRLACQGKEGECGCMMHQHCLRNWLRNRETCPIHADKLWVSVEGDD